jgi:hypothetical protein
MRRLLLCFATLSLPLFACSSTADNTDSSTQGETARGTVCSDDDRATAANRMINEPIKPPRMFAGIDLAGGDTWTGLTVEASTAVLCQATDVGKDDTGTTVEWGSAIGAEGAFMATYDNQTHMITSWQANQGYKGSIDFKSRPGTAGKPNPFGDHTYSIGVGRMVLRDGEAWQLAWTGPEWDRQATEMYDAMMYTFAPEMQGEQVSCIAAQTCLAKALATDGIFGVRPLGVYLHVADAHAKQPASSTTDYLYGFFVKLMPFSRPDTFLKLDDEGPIAEATGLGAHDARCTIKLGQTFKSFVDDCVSVLDDAAANQFQKQKLLGGAHINPAGDTWVLQAQGVVPSFTVTTAKESAPALAATMSGLSLDVRASGKSRNEYARDGQTFTLGATAAIYREYARYVQDALHAAVAADLPKFPIGAPECLSEQPARGCTGVESFITPAQPDTGNPGVDRVSVGPDRAQRLGVRTALKATTLSATFCADPGTFEHCFGKGDGGASGALFQTTADRVSAILGDATPEAAKSVDFYVPLFAKAVVTYLRAASLYPTDLSKPEYAGFEPAATDIAVDGAGSTDTDLRTVRYQNKLAISLLAKAGLITEISFHK